ncbi:MAG TPA: hypoxanthine phosphoribosyltransferase [Edaphocola sp.]|nr:hypoxanthine phosphoribosyltransferase [Edaphocola sp.]
MTDITIINKTFQPFISAGQIRERVLTLAENIREDFRNELPLFLVVLKGAYFFAKDLIQAVNIPCTVGFIRLSSYDSLQSSNIIQEGLGLTDDIKDRRVIIIEDIVESGRTLYHALQKLKTEHPVSIKVCSLLVKPSKLRFPVRADYYGFEISEAFVVGYGLDYCEQGRELADIYQLKTIESSKV